MEKVDLGVDIPTWARNNNCVQDAAYRLRARILRHGPEATAKPWEREIIEEFRGYLVAWIDHVRHVGVAIEFDRPWDCAYDEGSN